MSPARSIKELERENEELRARLEEAEDVLRAIRRGEVDAIVLAQDEGEQVALILSPSSQNSRTGSRKAHFVARSLKISDVDQFVEDRQGLRRHDRSLTLGIGPRARALHGMIQDAAQSDSTVLLEGETGTGKSLIARWIYEHSQRAGAAFVEINCAALRGDLLANELFGHMKGAFTSAVENKQGLLDVANGGTLFLDEIGDMDLAVQAQFLKVLEEKRYRRLGGLTEEISEFRLICATNRDLNEDMNSGRFRKDLFYRIHVFPMNIPPLRERPEDIPGIARTILQSLGASDVLIEDHAMLLLQTYSWPGNIRELRNVLERGLLLSRRNTIRTEHLPGLNSSDESEETRIQNAIRRFDGNKKKAAQFLGISRVTLYRKLKQP